MGTTRALVIDDNESIRGLLATVLEHKGFEVQTAANGARALDLLNRRNHDSAFSPDVILLDMSMPVMDGPTFVENYFRLPGPHVPIVGVTASPWQAAPVASSLDAVLVKPFRIKDLVALLDGAVARNAATVDAVPI